MNIQDVELDEEKIPWDDSRDLLRTIFEGQLNLMDRYHDIEKNNGGLVVEPEMHGVLDDRQVQNKIKEMAYRVIEELSEATNCLKNKPWKSTYVSTDVDHFYEELADAFHFFVEMLIICGIDADALFKLYYLKNSVNQFRQQSNY